MNTQQAGPMILEEELWICVLENDVPRLQELIETHSKTLSPAIFLQPQQGTKGTGMLFSAAQYGRTHLIDQMIKIGVDLEAMDSQGFKAIHYTARNGHLWTFNYLTSFMGVSIESRDSQLRTPLHWAVWGGHDDLIRHLIRQNCNVNCRDHEEGTPLHWASQMGRTAAVKCLLDAGANTTLAVRSAFPTAYDMAANAAQKDPSHHRRNITSMLAKHPPIGTTVIEPKVKRSLLHQPIYYLPMVLFTFLELGFSLLSAMAGFMLILLVGGAVVGLVRAGFNFKEQEAVPLGILHWGWLHVIFFYRWIWITTPQLYLNHIIFSIGVLFMSISYYYAFTANPGVWKDPISIPGYLDLLRRSPSVASYCLACQQVKRQRSHHCNQCGYCVRRYDHHCPWTGNCVGSHNQLEFVGYLIGHLICNVCIAISSFTILGGLYMNGPDSLWTFLWKLDGYASGMIITCVIIPIIAFLAVGSLFWFQARRILSNTTTKEYMHAPKTSSIWYEGRLASLKALFNRWQHEVHEGKL